LGPQLVLLALTVYAPVRDVADRAAWLAAKFGCRQAPIGSAIVVLLAFVAGCAVIVSCQSAPVINQTTNTANYKMLLIVGPPVSIYTPDQVKTEHPTNGEVMFSGTVVLPPGMAGRPSIAASSYPPGWYHLEVHVSDRLNGKIITDATPVITIHDTTTDKTTTLPFLTMQGIRAGPGDFHYGNNAKLASGDVYTLTTQVHADTGTFRFHR
jgi:hypothetical protein